MFRFIFGFFPFLWELSAVGVLLDLILTAAIFVFIVRWLWREVIKPFVRAAEKYADSESQGKNDSE